MARAAQETHKFFSSCVERHPRAGTIDRIPLTESIATVWGIKLTRTLRAVFMYGPVPLVNSACVAGVHTPAKPVCERHVAGTVVS